MKVELGWSERVWVGVELMTAIRAVKVSVNPKRTTAQ